ncbi:MAG: DUF2917 domain-containing protein [Burkholderiales bacterium]|jgi:hypothetical protein
MHIEIDKEVRNLQQNHNLTLRGGDGSCIHVHWGRVWVTRDGDMRDHIVGRGESLAIDRSGMTLVTAMKDSGVSVMQRCEPVDAAIANASAAGSDDAETYPLIDYPGFDQIDFHVRRAKQLRARYFVAALQRGWNALRRIFGMSPAV